MDQDDGVSGTQKRPNDTLDGGEEEFGLAGSMADGTSRNSRCAQLSATPHRELHPLHSLLAFTYAWRICALVTRPGSHGKRNRPGRLDCGTSSL